MAGRFDLRHDVRPSRGVARSHPTATLRDIQPGAWCYILRNLRPDIPPGEVAVVRVCDVTPDSAITAVALRLAIPPAPGDMWLTARPATGALT